MPAEIFIQRHTGSARSLPFVGTNTTRVTSITRLACSDSPADGTAHPLPVPVGGTNYSWWASLRFTAGTPGGLINNLQFYTDGNPLPQGIICAVSTAKEDPGYMQASGTVLSGNVLNVFNYPGLTFSPINITECTIKNPLPINGSLLAGEGNRGFGDFIVYQFAVSSSDTRTYGPLPPINFYLSYDEL